MKNILILLTLLVSMFISCTRNERTYTKYVYDYPKYTYPYEAVTEVDIWDTRLRFRNLLKINDLGLIENDLAQDVTKMSETSYRIQIKPEQYLSTNEPINAQAIKKAFEHSVQNSQIEALQNIKAINIINNLTLEIKLKKPRLDFYKLLATHFFSIYCPEKSNCSSGIYTRSVDIPNQLIQEKDASLPSKVDYQKLSENDIIHSTLFDTALAYTITPSQVKFKPIKYSVHESWGFVLNLKSKFKNHDDRKCLNTSLDREHLIKEALVDHSPASSINNRFQSNSSCLDKLSFSLLIPEEAGATGNKLCSVIGQWHKVNCIYLPFQLMLQRISETQFDAALLSLTLDNPYLESYLNYLKPNENFSILNENIEVPLNLTLATGNDFYEKFERFLYENAYFISLSKPIRTIYSSNKKYRPSLINPAYDPISNLKNE